MSNEASRFVVKKMVKRYIDTLVAIEAFSDENFWDRHVFRKFVFARHHGGLVAMDAMGPVGSVAFEVSPSERRLQIWNLVVHPQFRGKGVGRLLLKRLTARVPSEFASICANVREENLAAQRLLRSAGFWCYGIARNYFVDQTPAATRKEDAYCFEFNPSEERKKDVPLRIVDRSGVVCAGPRAGCREGYAVDVADGGGGR